MVRRCKSCVLRRLLFEKSGVVFLHVPYGRVPKERSLLCRGRPDREIPFGECSFPSFSIRRELHRLQHGSLSPKRQCSNRDLVFCHLGLEFIVIEPPAISLYLFIRREGEKPGA